MELNRRLFLFAAAAAPLYPATPLNVLSDVEGKLVEALCAQIVPADDDPGAKEAGVLYYIDRQLAGPLKRFAPAYKQGLAALGPEFAARPFAEQTAYLLEVEAGRHGAELASLFRLVTDHVMQGFYGSPDHGGNRDEASWKMLGITSMMHGGHGH